MSCVIKKSLLEGSYVVPSSKSQAIRAILFATLAKGTSTITNALISSDTLAMVTACKQLGAKFSINQNQIQVKGTGLDFLKKPRFIDCKNSGLILRFLPAISALDSYPLLITGDHSIQTKRPLAPLLDGLKQLGGSYSTVKKIGFAPAFIKGPIKPGTITVDGRDSQPISALLIALSFLKGKSEVFVKNPGEIAWVDLTLDWLDRFSLGYKKHSPGHYTIRGGGKIPSFSYHVRGDFSAAFYPIAAALITNSSVTVENLDFTEKQPDKQFILLAQKMGAKFSVQNNSLTVHKDSKLKGCIIDMSTCIDALSILAVLGCFASGRTVLKNALIARSKECDRISCITKELRKMGAKITETLDSLVIEQSYLQGTSVQSYQDHRMVFSLTCAALGAKGETNIEGTSCIQKTNPWFFEKMKGLGGFVSFQNDL